MWGYLIAILGLGVLCAAWVLFEQWLRRVDPEGCERRGSGCGGCGTCENNKRSVEES